MVFSGALPNCNGVVGSGTLFSTSPELQGGCGQWYPSAQCRTAVLQSAVASGSLLPQCRGVVCLSRLPNCRGAVGGGTLLHTATL